MCLAVPARIVELNDDRAVVDAMGNRWAIPVSYTHLTLPTNREV